VGKHLSVAIGEGIANDDTVEKTLGRTVVDSVDDRISITSTMLMVEYVGLVVEVMKLLSGPVRSLELALLL
jgi:hypothetical protein